MIRKIKESTADRILKDVSKVLQDAAAPIFVRHPCDKSSDGIWELAYSYGDVPRFEPMTPAEVRRGSGEAVDDYNMSVISPVSTDKYACNVYSAFVEYLESDLSSRVSDIDKMIRYHRSRLEATEAELEEVRVAVQHAWIMARAVANDVRDAIDQYSDCSASDMEYWAMEIRSTLISVGRNGDGSMNRPVGDVSLDSEKE